MQTISIVVPVYFNEGSLSSLFEKISEIERQLDSEGALLDLIFVDDGSGDGSLAELLKIKAIRPQTKVIRHSRNFGAMEAIRTGMSHAEGDCFTCLSADLQDPPELVIEMFRRWKAGSLFTICERDSREDPLGSRIFSYIYYKAVKFFVSKDFPSGGYDLALMDKIFMEYILRDGKSFYLPIFAWHIGIKPEIIKYHRQKRHSGVSRWTFSKKLKAATDNILGYSFLPIRMLSFLGMMIALISFLYGTFVVFNTLLFGREVPGFATIVVVLSFIQGLVLCILGLLGEYIWRIYAELNGRPRAVIEKIY